MEDRETARMRKYGESKTTRIMMATVPHVISGLGLGKFQADGFLLTGVYNMRTFITFHLFSCLIHFFLCSLQWIIKSVFIQHLGLKCHPTVPSSEWIIKPLQALTLYTFLFSTKIQDFINSFSQIYTFLEAYNNFSNQIT